MTNFHSSGIYHQPKWEKLKQYIEFGTDVGVKDIHGKTALMWASFHGRTEIKELLKEATFQKS